MSLRDNVAFLTFMSVHFILVAIVHTKITYGITILFHHYYYGLRCLCNNLMTDLLQTYYIWQWVVNTQVTSLLWRDLELSGFTMPLLGNLQFNALHSFSQDSMNSPTIVLTL
jgi:hypothetical protein